jgi:hypothetical protein
MHFSHHLRLRRKPKTTSEPELEISAPVSQPFDYGSTGVPPWMNDYSTHITEPAGQRHAARSGNYHTKHAYVKPDWASSSSCSSSLKTPAHDPNRPPPLLQVPLHMAVGDEGFVGCKELAKDTYGDEIEAGVKGNTKKRRLGLFGRNRGLDERGQLAEEWEEIYSDDWGCPDEYSRNKRRWFD